MYTFILASLLLYSYSLQAAYYPHDISSSYNTQDCQYWAPRNIHFVLDPTSSEFYPQSYENPMLVDPAVIIPPTIYQVLSPPLIFQAIQQELIAEFFEACYQCDPITVHNCLFAGVDPHSQKNGLSALHKATIKRNIDPIKRTITLNILSNFFRDPDAPRYKGLTALQKACLEGSISGVQELLKYEASITLQTNNKCNALFFALWSKAAPNVQLTLCQILLQQAKQQDDDITSLTNDRHQTPLCIALDNLRNKPDDHIINPYSHNQYYEEKLAIAHLILKHTRNRCILRKAKNIVIEAEQEQQIDSDDADNLILQINDKLHNLRVRIILPSAP